jgi:hypothetical protein
MTDPWLSSLALTSGFLAPVVGLGAQAVTLPGLFAHLVGEGLRGR